jgi:ketosteroid isomerase-like protein
MTKPILAAGTLVFAVSLLFYPALPRLHAKAQPSMLSKDQQAIIALDQKYQAAVLHGDAATMDAILAPDFQLIIGDGSTYSKADLLRETKSVKYTQQQDREVSVRVWGNTAVLTATLDLKGSEGGKEFSATVRFSDVYVRTPRGWLYVSGQASSPLKS